jgi:glycosyltransferase 2 family protein
VSFITKRVVSIHREDLRTIAGYSVAAICLAWVFHDVQLGPMLSGIRALQWNWVGLAIVVDVASYLTQGLRWKLLLRPVGDVSWLEATQAIYAGLFTSEVLPMRPGEVLRAYIVSKRLNIGIASVFPSIIVERLFDGLWLAVGVGIAATLVPLPSGLLRAGDVLGVLILVATAWFAYEVFRRHDGREEAPVAEPARPRGSVARFHEGFQRIGHRHETFLAFWLSLGLLVAQVLAFWLVMIAYGLDTRVWLGAAALLIIHLGTAVPNAPANVGTYQFFCVLALTWFGIDKSVATGFAVVVFVVLTIPLWVLGALALGRCGVTLASVRAEVDRKRG